MSWTNYNKKEKYVNKAISFSSEICRASGSYAIDCNAGDFFVIEAAGSFTLNSPINPVDGQAIDVNIWNVSGAAITISWPPNIRIAGWVDPANGGNRSVRLRYNVKFGRWYVIGISSADASN